MCLSSSVTRGVHWPSKLTKVVTMQALQNNLILNATPLKLRCDFLPDSKITHDDHNIVSDRWTVAHLQLSRQSSNNLLTESLIHQT